MPPAKTLRCFLARKEHGRDVRLGRVPAHVRDFRVANACLTTAQRRLNELRRRNRRRLRAMGRDIRGKHIHHRDGDPRNNSLSNLEILTPREHRMKHRQSN